MLNKIAEQYRRPVYRFADGGEIDTAALRAQLEAGPRTQAALDQAFATYSPAQLAAAFPEFGGVEQYTQAAAEAAARNSPPPAQDTGGFTAGPVVGPGALPDNYTIPGGTMDQGYSRDYTPEQRIGINQAYIRSQQDANYGVKGLMADMEKTGVSAKDLALSYGIDPHSVGQYLTRGGASSEFGGIDDNYDRAAQDKFIAWQNSQPNPAGQGTMGDVYKAQGISDTDPIRRAQAQEIIDREARRNAMRASAGAEPAPSPSGGGGFSSGPGGDGGGGTQPGPGPGQPQPFTPPPVYQPPLPFTSPNGTIYPNSIQTPQGPQPTYFPTSWWTSSPTASNAYGRTTGSTARNFDAEMADYRAKYAPVLTRPAPPPPIPVPAASTAFNPATKPTQDPGPGMEWFWNGAAWVVRFAGQNDNQPGSSSGSGGGGDSGAGASGSGTGSGVGNSGEGGGGPGTGGWARGGEVNNLWNKYHGR